VGAAAVGEVIDVGRGENLIDRAAESGKYFMDQLRDLGRKHSLVGNVRGQGLMIGFDLLLEELSKTEETANNFMFGCRQRGLHLTFGYGSRSFRIIPPLVISRPEIDFAIDVMDRCLGDLTKRKPSSMENLPINPYTSRLFERRPISRLISSLWKSSPERWLEKAREIAREKLVRG
jgi:acetylornithine/succinyldiaminopimelate/putrescine aminotransferase